MAVLSGTPRGLVEAIVEDGDATPAQKEIEEINTGTYSFDRALLEEVVRGLSPDNNQGEYYLTDVIGLLRRAGGRWPPWRLRLQRRRGSIPAGSWLPLGASSASGSVSG